MGQSSTCKVAPLKMPFLPCLCDHLRIPRGRFPILTEVWGDKTAVKFLSAQNIFLSGFFGDLKPKPFTTRAKGQRSWDRGHPTRYEMALSSTQPVTYIKSEPNEIKLPSRTSEYLPKFGKPHDYFRIIRVLN